MLFFDLRWVRRLMLCGGAAVLFSTVGCATVFGWIFPLDEGERLSEQIGKAAEEMRRTGSDQMVIKYEPKKGVDQFYYVGLAKVEYQPHPPFKPPYPGLTVTVTKGRSGFCNYHVQYVGVPRGMRINKNGEPLEVVLQKVGNEIDVVDLR